MRIESSMPSSSPSPSSTCAPTTALTLNPTPSPTAPFAADVPIELCGAQPQCKPSKREQHRAKRAERAERQAAAKAEKRRNLRGRRTKLHKFVVEDALNAIPKEQLDQRPINFSMYTLTDEEEALLTKGPSYVIAPRYVDTINKLKAFDKYSNQIRVRGLKAEQEKEELEINTEDDQRIPEKYRRKHEVETVLRDFVCKRPHMSEQMLTPTWRRLLMTRLLVNDKRLNL